MIRRPGNIGFLALATIFVALSAAVVVSLILQNRKAEALVEIAAAHSELEIVLSNVALRLSSIAGNIRQSADFSPRGFQRIVDDASAPTMRRQERALAFIPVLAAGQDTIVDSYIERWRADYTALGYPEYRRFPDAPGERLMPVLIVEPASGRENVFGYDMGTSIERTEAGARALASGLPVLTAPVELSQDSGSDDRGSFLVIYPLDLPDAASLDGIQQGVLAAGMTPASLFLEHVNIFSRTLVDVSIGLTPDDVLEIRLADESLRASDPWVVPMISDYSLPDVELPGIRVSFRASAFYSPTGGDALRVLAGMAIAALLSFLVYRLLQSREAYSKELELAVARKEVELREAERINARTQRMESLGRLVGGVAHDFNNILYVVMGNLELLAASRLAPDKQEFVRQALNASHRGAHLTKQLLAFGRRSHLRPERTDVNETLVDTVKMLQRVLPESVAIRSESAPDLWLASVDPAGLDNAILNLALNAKDAMKDKGELVIDANNVTIDEKSGAEPCDGELEPGRYVAVTVSDNGCGMDTATLERAAEPFFSTKSATDGSGLGLPSVLGFCRQSGGACFIDSKPGAGTRVRMLFPVESSTASEGKQTIASAAVKAGGRLLLAEDDPNVASLMAQQLRAAGYDVTVALSGDQAVENVDGGETFDLLIADVVMSGELQGPDLARRFADRHRNPGVLFVSGYSEDVAPASEVIGLRHELLQKPVPEDDLLATVARLIGSKTK